MSYERPTITEVAQHKELLVPDDNAADTRLVAGTRKLMMVMFWLLKIDLPPQQDIDNHINEVSKDI